MRGLVSLADYQRLERENERLRDKIIDLRLEVLDAKRVARAELERDLKARAEPLVCGPMTVDFASALVSVAGRDSRLTPCEYRVVERLALSPGAFVPKWTIYDHLYREPDDGPGIKVIDVFVSKVRRKLGAAANCIQTANGRGYRLIPPGLIP